MADTKKKASEATNKPTESEDMKVSASLPVSSYSAEELAENHKIFDTSREIVTVALRLSGMKSFTLEEAKNIIKKFKNKEVI